MMSHSIDHLLTVHHAMQVQRDAVLDKQWHQLYKHIVEQIMQMCQVEAPFLHERSQLLKQIRPYLEKDARSVLSTAVFRLFIEQFLSTCLRSPSVMEHLSIFSVDTSTWLLSRLEIPLRLNHYQLIQDDRSYAFHLTASLAAWQQTFTVSIVRPTTDGSEPEFFGVYRQ